MQPERMSTPCTYPHNDWLMYVLYYHDVDLTRQMISTAIESIRSTHSCPNVSRILDSYRPSDLDCHHTLRIKLLVLLDQDEYTRAQLCNYTCKLVRDRRPVPPEKGSRFYAALHDELLPAWVRDGSVPACKFVDSVRMAYLVS